jgi:pyridinium-3,5-bisthiocarboxylic acid mononucleotide nickel chelatase
MPDLWVDAQHGISGDMLLGALLECGWPLAALQQLPKQVGLPRIAIRSKRVRRGAWMATQVRMTGLSGNPQHRSLTDIQKIIQRSKLPREVQQSAQRIFTSLADVEARLHGIAKTKVHFHELGAEDTILDVVGICKALYDLGIQQLVSTSINVGHGVMTTEHGSCSIPAPATLELLQGFAFFSAGPAAEHTTPTGAAILRAWAKPWQTAEPLILTCVGYGAGTRQWHDYANIVRVGLIKSGNLFPPQALTEKILALTTQVDDVTPQVIGYVQEKLLQLHALDVTVQSVLMKKQRLGHRLEVLCKPEHALELVRVLFQELPTLGIRWQWQSRLILPRQVEKRSRGALTLRVKTAQWGKHKLAALPEYDDVAQIAIRENQPLVHVLNGIKKQPRRFS